MGGAGEAGARGAATGRLLVVEDEPHVRDGLVTLFESQGFEVHVATSGPAGLEQALARPLALVVLDLMLPGLSGLDVLRRLRAAGMIAPVLVLTAKGAEADVVAGLEAGADDYVVKPFGIHELVARVRGLLRRRAPEAAPRRLRVGAAVLDLDGLRVEHPGGVVGLSAREASLLDYLVARRHRVVTRVELLVDVWGYRDGTIQTRTIDVHVLGLRKRLREVPGGERWIGTVRGRGYRFEAELDG